MGLILDTSAVIGWIEHQSEDLISWLLTSDGDATPAVHVVTLGELAQGVRAAPNSRVRSARLDTLRFCQRDLDVIELTTGSRQSDLYGLLSSATSRKVSSNDRWITAAAVDLGDTLVTTDRRLADQINLATNATLGTELGNQGLGLEVRCFERS